MTDKPYDTFFSALSGGHRLKIIQHLLTSGPQNVTEIVEATEIEQSLASRNLSQLLACAFVHIEVRGKHRYYSLNKDTIVPLFDLIDRHITEFCTSDCNCCVTTSVARSQPTNARSL